MTARPSARLQALLLVTATLPLACGSDAPPTPAGSGLRVRVTGEDGGLVGCRITVTGTGGTPSPRWGADDAGHVGRWISPTAVAVDATVVTTVCEVDVPLPAGSYTVTVSHGPLFDALAEEVEIRDGAATTVAGALVPAVDGAGFVCLDAHVHSAPSFDSDVPMDQRLVAAVAEGLDALIPTDHNAVAEWEPSIAVASVADRLLVVPGDEITTDQWGGGDRLGHFNVYPVPEGYAPASVAVPGETAASLVEAVRVVAPDAVLQINHPRWDGNLGYFTILGFDPATLAGLDARVIGDVQTLEVWNGHELDLADGPRTEDTLVDWYALLNAGHPLVGVANSDTHRLARSPVGTPRTCVELLGATARPTVDDLLDALRAGRAFGTSGPWVELHVGEATLGDTVRGRTHTARVEVAAAPWVDVDTVTLVVDGVPTETRTVGELPATLELPVSVEEDVWLLVLVDGDDPLPSHAGEHALPMRSFAFTNPVFIDADGDGLWSP